MKKPAYYRETLFFTPTGKQVLVAGLAKLNYGGQNPYEVMAYLKDHGIYTIFGLEASPEFLVIAKELELNYVDVTIPDFTAPSLSIYDRVYDEILSQEKCGKKVAIHCHGGMGRTGTVLAAIKLREMSMHKAFFEPIGPRVECYPSKSCTQQVCDAVFAIRSIPGSEHAIEDPVQIESLCNYEIILRNKGWRKDNTCHQNESTDESHSKCGKNCL